jgi:radical SAM protein with 4Fe4S-binding SPASM domain
MKLIKKSHNFFIREKRLPTYGEIMRGFNIKKNKVPLPTFVQLEPTTKCNLNCVMCTRSTMNPKRLNQDLSLEKFQYILKEIPTIKKIKLQGMGEPLLNKEIFKITQFGKKKNIKFTTTINGTLINSDNIDLILENFQEIVISLDAANKEDYLQIRRVDLFDKVIEGIKLIVKRKKELNINSRIILNSVISHLNYQEVPLIVDFGKNCEVDSIGFVEVENWKTPLEQDYEGEKKFIQQSRKFKKEIQKMILEYYKEKNSMEIQYLFSDRRKNKCLWPFFYCFITVDGFITPCCIRMDPEVFNFGNIFEEPFKEIWNGIKYQKFREAMIKNLSNPICDNCPD